ncbi:unnamed protein product [Prorocentrum cordatum]|uniref:Uncharacterized protein n=1 Tax=Prorocentrum cordatum TaxID=2364126 RepID=A0ABN9TB17_9DINO|nr:unnamed protein product [Polarella glacialis]
MCVSSGFVAVSSLSGGQPPRDGGANLHWLPASLFPDVASAGANFRAASPVRPWATTAFFERVTATRRPQLPAPRAPADVPRGGPRAGTCSPPPFPPPPLAAPSSCASLFLPEPATRT